MCYCVFSNHEVSTLAIVVYYFVLLCAIVCFVITKTTVSFNYEVLTLAIVVYYFVQLCTIVCFVITKFRRSE